jgi:hypothetical protein
LTSLLTGFLLSLRSLLRVRLDAGRLALGCEPKALDWLRVLDRVHL